MYEHAEIHIWQGFRVLSFFWRFVFRGDKIGISLGKPPGKHDQNEGNEEPFGYNEVGIDDLQQ